MKSQDNSYICMKNLMKGGNHMFSPLRMGTNHMLGTDTYVPLTTNE